MLMNEVWKSGLIMATWNVRAMLIPGKMQEISKEIMDDIVADLKVIKIKQWMEKTKDREEWRLIVEEVTAHPGL
jgi:hypothetical protein